MAGTARSGQPRRREGGTSQSGVPKRFEGLSPGRATRGQQTVVAPPDHDRAPTLPWWACHCYPPFVPRGLSPAVDNRPGRSPQMWTSPGEIDVDKHRASPSCPPPVDGCGFPVEGSGDDESVASRRHPQAWAQTRWIAGGYPVDNGGQPLSRRGLWTRTRVCTLVTHMQITGG